MFDGIERERHGARLSFWTGVVNAANAVGA